MKDHQKLEYPVAYNQRDVLTLKSLSQWTQEEERIHLACNRILQPGFATRDSRELIGDAKLAGEDWLTDVVCPGVEGALTLCLAKEMVVTYKVGEEELNTQNQKAYELLFEDNPDIQDQLEKKINSSLSKLVPSGAELESRAKSRLERNNSNRRRNGLPELPISDESLDAAKNIELDLIRKQATYEIVDEYVQSKRRLISKGLGLELKDIIPPSENKDFAFLGAAGSGKSTISKQFLNDEQKKNCVIVATDNYRAFSVPGFMEQDAGRNVFAQTQDLAYMVKELVQEDMLRRVDGRPDIIFDAVTLDSGTKQLLRRGAVTSAVAAYSGAGLVGIAERADYRARDKNAAPADKGRFVHTSALLEGHANASERLLTSVPDQAITTIYDTNVERGQPAIAIGTIDTTSNTLEIRDLRVLSEFLNKKNINTEAAHQVDLIYNPKNPLNLLSTHPENKAKAILDLIPETRFKPAFTIKVKDEHGVEYVELRSNESGVELNVLNPDIFVQKASSETIEGGVLRAITRQIEKGGIEHSFNAAFELGDQEAFKQTIIDAKQELLKPVVLERLEQAAESTKTILGAQIAKIRKTFSGSESIVSGGGTEKSDVLTRVPAKVVKRGGRGGSGHSR